MTCLTNSFSLNMLSPKFQGYIKVTPLSLAEAQTELTKDGRLNDHVTSAVGHLDTANIMASALGVSDNLHNRLSVSLKQGDSIFVCQYQGQRLPEGATTLPEGASLVWYLVYLPYP